MAPEQLAIMAPYGAPYGTGLCVCVAWRHMASWRHMAPYGAMCLAPYSLAPYGAIWRRLADMGGTGVSPRTNTRRASCASGLHNPCAILVPSLRHPCAIIVQTLPQATCVSWNCALELRWNGARSSLPFPVLQPPFWRHPGNILRSAHELLSFCRCDSHPACAPSAVLPGAIMALELRWNGARSSAAAAATL